MSSSDERQWSAFLKPEQYALLTQATAGLERAEGFFVTLSAQGKDPDPTTVQAFADGLHLDPFTARQRLLAPCPRILRREERREAAREWVAWLRGLGLSAFEFSEGRLLTFAPQPVSQFDIRGQTLELGGPDGHVAEIPAPEISCIVAGSVRCRSRVTSRGADLAGLLHPGQSNVTKAGVETVYDLHGPGSCGVFRLAEDTVRFEAPADGPPRMHHLLSRLRGTAFNARIINDFARAAPVLGESTQFVRKSFDLGYRPGGGGFARMGLARNETVEDSEATAFDLYSLLSAFQVTRG